jgi:ABC-2 type transport system permease protein
MYPILKKEITSYLSSLVAYVTIGIFLLVLGLFLWVFPESSVLDYGYAGLDSLFNTAPYLFMFLVPAITMRSLAEERKEGTFELLLTRPLTHWQIVLGKYIAAVVIVLFALIPTLVYYYSVYTLGMQQGNIDTGGVIGSYIGLFLLGASFAAIGLFASSITKNQIIAFAIAVFLCFFIYSGFDSLSGLLALQSLTLQDVGISEHYQSISRGVLDTRDLAYFIILIGAFIGFTLMSLLKQQQKNFKDKYVLGLLVVLFLINLLSNVAFTRFDFTKEKRYTLSPISRDIMDGLKQPVRITVFLQGDFPGGMKRLQHATKDMLSDLQAYSHGQMLFDFIDPIKGLSPDAQDQAVQSLKANGLEPTFLSVKTDDGLTQKLMVPGAYVVANGKQVPVNLLLKRVGLSDDEQLNISIQNLEYAFSSAIKKVIAGGKPQIGFTAGHNELTDLQLNDAMRSLSDGFEVGRIDLKLIPFDSLKKIKLVIIAKPDKPFTELEKFKLDQYIMQGGRVLWSIDQVSAELDSLRGHGGEQLAFAKQLNLDDQLFTYGVRINYDLIADLSAAQIPISTGSVGGGQPQIQLVPWLFYPIFMPVSKNPIVKNLDGIRGEFTNTIDTLALKNIKKTVLLASSPYNKKLNAPHVISLQSVEQEPNPKEFQSVPKTIAVLLEGSFTSGWKNRPLPEGLTEKITPLQQSKPTKMVVISDGDIFKNAVALDGSPYPLGYDHYTNKSFGNKNLLLNIADYMTDDSGLIALRNKEIQLRLLDRARIRSEKLYWQIINTAVPLLLVLIFAIFQHYIRKRKYAR